MSRRRPDFSFVVPFLALVVWAVAVVLPVTVLYVRLLHAAHGLGAVRLNSVYLHTTVSRADFFSFAVRWGTFSTSRFITGMNLPAHSVDLLISRFNAAWPTMWHPARFDDDSWDALVFPIYCLPFWILAGVGIDALTGKKVRWPWLLLGTVLCGFFLFLACGLTFALTAEDHAGMYGVFWGFAFWIVLLAAHPVAWFRRWRRLRMAGS